MNRNWKISLTEKFKALPGEVAKLATLAKDVRILSGDLNIILEEHETLEYSTTGAEDVRETKGVNKIRARREPAKQKYVGYCNLSRRDLIRVNRTWNKNAFVMETNFLGLGCILVEDSQTESKKTSSKNKRLPKPSKKETSSSGEEYKRHEIDVENSDIEDNKNSLTFFEREKENKHPALTSFQPTRENWFPWNRPNILFL